MFLFLIFRARFDFSCQQERETEKRKICKKRIETNGTHEKEPKTPKVKPKRMNKVDVAVIDLKMSSFNKIS